MTTKNKALTLPQIRTLVEIKNGTMYSLREDGKKAHEARWRGIRQVDVISAPSVPVLYRVGMVDFVHDKPTESGKYGSIRLTSKGLDFLKELL